MSGRIRTVKPEWLEDELLAAASDEARVLSVGLILLADDYGNGRASIATIAAEVWRYALERDDGATAPEVLAKASRAFRELLAIGFIGTWTEAGQRYFAIRNWLRHQRVDKPGKPLVPKPPAALFAQGIGGKTEDSGKPREPVATVSGVIPESLRPDLRPGPTTNDQEGKGARGAELAATAEAKAPAAVAAPTAKPQARRWRRVPADWQPKPEHVALAMQIGVDLNAEFVKFRDHEFRDPKTDADACFRTWLRRSVELRREAIGQRPGGNRAGDLLGLQLARASALEELESGPRVTTLVSLPAPQQKALP